MLNVMTPLCHWIMELPQGNQCNYLEPASHTKKPELGHLSEGSHRRPGHISGKACVFWCYGPLQAKKPRQTKDWNLKMTIKDGIFYTTSMVWQPRKSFNKANP